MQIDKIRVKENKKEYEHELIFINKEYIGFIVKATNTSFSFVNYTGCGKLYCITPKAKLINLIIDWYKSNLSDYHRHEIRYAPLRRLRYHYSKLINIGQKIFDSFDTTEFKSNYIDLLTQDFIYSNNVRRNVYYWLYLMECREWLPFKSYDITDTVVRKVIEFINDNYILSSLAEDLPTHYNKDNWLMLDSVTYGEIEVEISNFTDIIFTKEIVIKSLKSDGFTISKDKETAVYNLYDRGIGLKFPIDEKMINFLKTLTA